MPHKPRNAPSTCSVALDGIHRWVAPARAYPVEQLSLGFTQCAACGAVKWPNGSIEGSLNPGRESSQ